MKGRAWLWVILAVVAVSFVWWKWGAAIKAAITNRQKISAGARLYEGVAGALAGGRELYEELF